MRCAKTAERIQVLFGVKTVLESQGTLFVIKGKCKGKRLSEGTSLQKRSGMARVVDRFHSFYLLTDAFIYE